MLDKILEATPPDYVVYVLAGVSLIFLFREFKPMILDSLPHIRKGKNLKQLQELSDATFESKCDFSDILHEEKSAYAFYLATGYSLSKEVRDMAVEIKRQHPALSWGAIDLLLWKNLYHIKEDDSLVICNNRALLLSFVMWVLAVLTVFAFGAFWLMLELSTAGQSPLVQPVITSIVGLLLLVFTIFMTRTATFYWELFLDARKR
ncbi:MAG: hypothetical protein OIF51_04650 [Cellvibrionaceae bacterium]|nr:hypothetical protein [Cellvibrionaceae bacterium]